MAVEKVACPWCGELAWATIPDGQRLVQINKSGTRFGYTFDQTCSCKECGRDFVAETEDIDK